MLYRAYVAKLTQSGSGAPVATVLQNDFVEGEFTWTRTGTGQYKLTYSVGGTFDSSKTWVMIDSVASGDGNFAAAHRSSNTEIIVTYGNGVNTFFDSGLLRTSFELRVYQ